MTRYRTLVIGMLATLTVLDTAGGTAAAAPPGPEHAPATPIGHLVVMTQDQHSFDNYFGSRPGVDGLPPHVCLPAAEAGKACVAPFVIDKSRLQARLHTSARAEEAAVDGGRMDGFVRAQAGPHSDGSAAMGYYRQQDLPAMAELANRAVLFDHWFAGVPGGTVANRLFGMAAQAPGDPTVVPDHGWGTIAVIFDRLEAAGVSWRVYVQNYEPALTVETAIAKTRSGGQIARVPLLAMPRYTENPALASHIVDLSRYYSDLAAGTLPAVSWIVSTSSTERAPATTTADENPIITVANALISSSAWPSSAFVLDYDSGGGWYDHMPPPVVDGARIGLRVPAMLISPYAQSGVVNHTTYDGSAVLKFIESNWNVAPLTVRDRDAERLTSAFDFGHAPRQPALIDVGAKGPAVIQPSSLTLYLGYALAVIAATLAIGWAALGERRRYVVEGARP